MQDILDAIIRLKVALEAHDIPIPELTYSNPSDASKARGILLQLVAREDLDSTALITDAAINYGMHITDTAIIYGMTFNFNKQN